jgi:hypothetical protein
MFIAAKGGADGGAKMANTTQETVRSPMVEQILAMVRMSQAEIAQKRVTITFDADYANAFVAHLMKKHPELKSVGDTAVKGVLKYLFREYVNQALNTEGFVYTA